MNKKYQLIALIVVFLAVAAAVVWFLGTTNAAQLPVLHPMGIVGERERWLMMITVILSAFVVVPVFAFLFIFAFKYRDSNPNAKHAYAPEWKNGRVIEIMWWLIPAIIIFILAIITWISSHRLDPYRPLVSDVPPMTVQVVALDWKWLFIYPEQGIATVNHLEIPEKTPIHFYLTADAPMNSFWIPQLGGQIYAMPGMATQLHLMASSTGSFNGFAANINGDGFAGMTFTTKSDTSADFADWVETVRQSPKQLDWSAYENLAKPSEYNSVEYFSNVQEGLFKAVVMKYMMPAADMKNMNMTNMMNENMSNMAGMPHQISPEPSMVSASGTEMLQTNATGTPSSTPVQNSDETNMTNMNMNIQPTP